MKLLIGIPIHLNQEIPKQLKQDLANLKGDFDILFMRDAPDEEYLGDRIFRIAKARENLRKWALKEKYTHLLFLDSDISFPSETIEVLASQDGDIVSHSYPDKTNKSKISLGLGCTLIKREVLEKCSFIEGISEEGNFNPDGQGEDILFREKAKSAGFKIIDLDGKLEIKHLGYDTMNILDQWSKQARSKR